MGRAFRHPAVWAVCFFAWAGWLWWLSSGAREFPEELRFRNSDKLIHFGFFFGGAGLLSAFLYRLRPPAPSAWGKRLLLTAGIIAVIGASDEFHQSFVPGRSGNDPFDFAADFLGGLCGALAFRKLHRILEDPA